MRDMQRQRQVQQLRQPSCKTICLPVLHLLRMLWHRKMPKLWRLQEQEMRTLLRLWHYQRHHIRRLQTLRRKRCNPRTERRQIYLTAQMPNLQRYRKGPKADPQCLLGMYGKGPTALHIVCGRRTLRQMPGIGAHEGMPYLWRRRSDRSQMPPVRWRRQVHQV